MNSTTIMTVVIGSRNGGGDVAVGGAFTAASGSFTGNLAARRLLLADSTGGVTNPNIVIGAGAMAGIPSGSGGNAVMGLNALGPIPAAS